MINLASAVNRSASSMDPTRLARTPVGRAENKGFDTRVLLEALVADRLIHRVGRTKYTGVPAPWYWLTTVWST